MSYGIDITTTSASLYVSYADMDAKIGDLSALVPDGKTESDWVELFIADAQAQVNAALAERYDVPFTTVPDIIKVITFDLAYYRLLRENYTQQGGDMSEWVDEIRRRAEELLQKIADGEIVLDADEATADGMSMSSTTGLQRDFRRTTYDTNGVVVDTGNMDTW